jgi:type IV pilus assembly protein PilC
MATFKFTAVRASGEKYEGEKEAANKFVLYDLIRKEGGTVVHVEMAKDSASKSLKTPDFLNSLLAGLINRVKTADKIQFAKNLGVMIEAGLPMTRAISVMERQTKSPAFKKILSELNVSIGRGESLSTAMEKYPDTFSRLFVSMVRAGEESGSLTAALRSVGTQLERAYLLTKKIRGAMIYPAIIVSVMVIIAILMLIIVVPTLSSVFSELNVELPLMTRIVIGLSDFLKNNIFTSIAIALVSAGVLYYASRTEKGKRTTDLIKLKIPIINTIVKEANAARTARTLASLLIAGVDVLVALKISGEVVQNVFYKEIIKKAEVAVEKGKPMSAIFMAEEKLYPAFVGEMASIGEETGQLSQMFANIAEYYENEVEQKTKDLSTVIEPFLMVFIGIAVGFFAISMLTPIYSLVDVI